MTDSNGFRRIDRGRFHSYTYNGKKVPSVTELIGAGLPKPALVNWASKSVAEHVADNLEEQYVAWASMGRDSLIGMLAGIPSGDRDKAARRGTEVHGYAQLLQQGTEIEVPDELIGHVDAYLAFLDDYQPTEEIVERPVLSQRFNYAGTFDMIATLPGWGRCLIDLKTARSGIWPETALQLAAYRRADIYETPNGPDTMPPVEHTLGLWIRADGYDLYPINTDEDVFRTFLYVADTAQHFTKAPKERFIQPALPAPERAQ